MIRKLLPAGVLAMAMCLPAAAAFANESSSGEDTPQPTIVSPTAKPQLLARASEWREDWLTTLGVDETQFYSHLVASICGASSAGKQANVIEAVQRFRSREAAEQFRALHGDGMAVLKIEHPLVWSGAIARAKVGVAVESELFARVPEEVKPQAVSPRGEEPRVPVRSRTCSETPSQTESKAVLTLLGIGKALATQLTSESGAPPKPALIPSLSPSAEWSLIAAGDGETAPLSLASAGDPTLMLQAFENISSAATPLNLQFDVLTTSVNEGNTLRQRVWRTASGQTLQVALSDGVPSRGASAVTSLVVSLLPAPVK